MFIDLLDTIKIENFKPSQKICGGFFMPKKEVLECQGNLRVLVPILAVLSLLMIGTVKNISG